MKIVGMAGTAGNKKIRHILGEYDFGERIVKFSMLAKPTAKARPVFGKGKVFTPERTREYEETVREFAEAAMEGRPPVEFGVTVRCHFSFKSKKAGWRTSKPDLDNLIKAVTDGMNGIVYKDDSQIVAIGAGKANGDANEVEVEVLATPDFPGREVRS